jgi:uncharacterized protein YndB with AHSA1/START domain
MLKIILIVVVLAIAGLLAYATTRPDEFRVQRSLSIRAPAATIFPLVNDLTAWKQWSPYEPKDPNMQHRYEGPASGVGAKMAWAGNNQVGEGSMQIRESEPDRKIVRQLEFEKPMKTQNVAIFDFVSSGETTTVTWAMEGKANFVSKLMSVFFDMDQMIGGDFAQGLQNLKQITEQN